MLSLLLGLLILIIICIATFPFFAFALGKMSLFFTTCPSGNVKFIVRGETVVAIIHTGTEKFQPEEILNRTPLMFGLFWVGIPGINQVHEFLIDKSAENPQGTEPSDWLINRGEVKVDSLRIYMQRSFVFRNIELKDRTPVNVLVTTKLMVVNWFTAVFELKGKFFENAGSVLEAAVADILKDFTLEEFIAAPKGEVGGILEELKDDTGVFALEFIKQVGLEIQGIAMPRQDPGDQKLRDAMNALIIAQKEGQAKVANATASAEAKKLEAEGDKAGFQALVDALGGDAQKAAAVLRAQAIAKSSITTFVDGGGASTVLPIGGEKND